MLKDKNGVTLIALVVTIVILIILAVISINIAIGDNGLLFETTKAEDKHKISEIAEKLEMQKANVAFEGKVVNLENYLEQLKKDKIIEDNDIIETNASNARNIEVDGYIYLVKDLENGDVLIEYRGIASAVLPSINMINITKVTTSYITVEVETSRMNGGTFEYYIQNVTENGEYELKETTKNTTYTFSKLASMNVYKIKIKGVAEDGVATGETGNVETIEMQSLEQANLEFTYNPEGWTNDKVTVTVKPKVEINEGLILQTSKNAVDWETKDNQTYEENGEMYVRLYDGVNESNYALAEVSKIDKEKPEITSIVATSNRITITAKDDASGIIGYALTENDTEPTEFEECANTKELNITKKELLETTDYYIWVKDEAGNISEYVKTTTEETIALTNANTTFTYSEDDWTNNPPVTVTANVNIEIPDGYYIETSKDGGTTWQKQTSQTLSTNGEMYVRLSDGKNDGNYATAEVNKIDTTVPKVTKATPGQTSIAITATDEASGIVGYKVTDTNTEPSTFDICASTTSLSITKTGLTSGKDYWVWVKDAAGNVSASVKATTTTPVAYKYSSSGRNQVTLPAGKYKLEVWGAQGGDSRHSGYQEYVGANGGYSYGTLTLDKSTTLFIYVGGMGGANDDRSGGYNGGGTGSGSNYANKGAGGGGATHIATADGLLSALSSNKTAILLVAGGGRRF